MHRPARDIGDTRSGDALVPWLQPRGFEGAQARVYDVAKIRCASRGNATSGDGRSRTATQIVHIPPDDISRIRVGHGRDLVWRRCNRHDGTDASDEIRSGSAIASVVVDSRRAQWDWIDY